MKIAIPTDDKNLVANHFGRCLVYLCFDENGNELDEIKNTSEHMGGVGMPPDLLKQNNVDVLLCKDLGPNAINMCKKNCIKVYKMPEAEQIKDLYQLWQSGQLTEVSDDQGCESHN